MNVRPKCSFGRGKTPTNADRSVMVGVQELFMGVRFCIMRNSG